MSDCKERKIQNFKRYNLITKFYCADCGDQLGVSYPDDSLADAKDSPLAGIDPTGAAVRYNPIHVEPCKSCIGKHTEPAKKLAEAIHTLLRGEA